MRFMRWAERERSVRALILIGSQARGSHAPDAADRYSDWDFQVVTSHPELFDSRTWINSTDLAVPLTYVARGGRLGSARKVTALFPDGELDLVIIPSRKLGLVRWLQRIGLSRRIPAAHRALSDLSVVLRGGYRLVKGEREWAAFFTRVATNIPAPRLTDDDVRNVADGFVCDYLSTLRKIERGEMLAAQRWLHQHLAEVNFRLLQELRQRAGVAGFPDARRLEATSDARSLEAVRVAAVPSDASLREALTKSADTCRWLVRELVGDSWHWPLSSPTPAR
jgi:hypothetical protein